MKMSCTLVAKTCRETKSAVGRG